MPLRAAAVAACMAPLRALALHASVMMSFLTKLLDKPTMTEGASSAATGTRTAVARTLEHAQALSELLQVELAEYLDFQRRRGAYMVLAVVLLLVCYLLVCELAVVLLAPHAGWAGALALVLAANLMGAIILLLRAVALGKEPLAPATREELHNDWQCLKLLLKGNAKS